MLGIPWLQANGEAEAYCALLNSSEVLYVDRLKVEVIYSYRVV